MHNDTTKELYEFYELEKTVKNYGRKERVIKHFAPPNVNLFREIGIIPSIISSKKNVKEAIKEGNRFLMETDYIDDLTRPGAVMGPKTVPKTTLKLFSAGILTKDDIYEIHKENIENVYKINLE